jgi:hypothetical protein
MVAVSNSTSMSASRPFGSGSDLESLTGNKDDRLSGDSSTLAGGEGGGGPIVSSRGMLGNGFGG